MDNENIVYEDAIAELSSIVNKLNSGNVSLDDSIKLYSRGVELANWCDKKLNEVETKISIINKDNMSENPFLVGDSED